MAYAGVQMFMEKLKQFMYCNDIPMIANPLILCKRPQFQFLYEELGSMIQTLFIHEDQDLQHFEEVRKLMKRFKVAVEEAEDIVDLFLSAVHFTNKGYFARSDVYQTSLNLEEVMRSMESIKVEFMTIKIDNMKMDSSQGSDRLQLKPVTGPSHTRNLLGSKIVQEEMVVGFDRDAEIIRDKLVEDRKRLDVVCIVGMGGIGKSTLATKVYTDPFVVHHFYLRAWVTVSHTYEKRDVLIQALSSMGVKLEFEKTNDFRLREMLHKRLKGQRYLIVIDDIWSIEAWDKLKLFFPHDNNGSRILLTSRLTDVALHAKSHGLIHHLQHLTEEESWELLCGKVFQGDECPKCLIQPGIQIAKGCHGLPLSVVVIAGILAKEERSKDVWVKIACSVGSYIASDQKGCLEIIALSYHHLPLHLRECFLYLGWFQEDTRIYIESLIWLWMAEGFIQEDGSRSSREIAKDYVMDLVDRNLLIVVESRFKGDFSVCKVHDLVRQLCVEKAKEERFFLRIDRPKSKYIPQVMATYKQRRVFTNGNFHMISFVHPPGIRSLLYYTEPTWDYNVVEFFRSFALLRVLYLQNCEIKDFRPGLEFLIHLRYLNINISGINFFPPSICNLWNLQTLILHKCFRPIVLPYNISNLVNLRHLWSNRKLYLRSIRKPMKLEYISLVVLEDGTDNFQKCFPGIKLLETSLYPDQDHNFEVLLDLEILYLSGLDSRRRESTNPELLNIGKNHFRFPTTLKQLRLKGCGLRWSDMSIIQSLPNLEVLILRDNAFEGTLWETGEEQFQRLKFLSLYYLNIKQWEASSINFPCLERLRVIRCFRLEKIPLEIGDISTLQLLEVSDCSYSLLTSLQKIRQEQDDVGNDVLTITVDGRQLPSFVLEHDD